MKEFMEKLIERLEEIKTYYAEDFSQGYSCEVGCVERYEVEKIINELTEEYKPKTQADKIRSMSDEELAEFFSERDKIPNRYKCKEIEDWIKWLQSETE